MQGPYVEAVHGTGLGDFYDKARKREHSYDTPLRTDHTLCGRCSTLVILFGYHDPAQTQT